MKGMLESIKRLHKTTQRMRASRVKKSRGLMHVNLLFENTMKKCILNI
jgi:hypothetical protein